MAKARVRSAREERQVTVRCRNSRLWRCGSLERGGARRMEGHLPNERTPNVNTADPIASLLPRSALRTVFGDRVEDRQRRRAERPSTTEDQRFVHFLKENISIWTGASLIPVLTSAIGILEPPAGVPKLN